jgi:Large polyvalent protein associated domain 29
MTTTPQRKTPPRDVDIAEVGRIVRAQLKAAFPGVKFSVRSKRYSMGSHITVYWTDGPSTKRVEAITDQFYGTGFDAMTDSRTHHNSEWQGETVRFAGSRPSCVRDVGALS